MVGLLYLIRVEQTAHTVFNPQNVVVHRVEVVAVGARQCAQRHACWGNDAVGVNARKVERASWLQLGRIQTV